MQDDLLSPLLRLYQDLKWGLECLPVSLSPAPSESTILRHHVKGDAPLVFDVGANLGASVAFYRRIFPRARIFAFEPDPSTFARLERRHGRRQGVTLINAGVGAALGRLQLNRCSISATNSFLKLDQSARWVRTTVGLKELAPVEVDVITLDEVAAANGVEHIDFLKCDTQGFEPEVLQGAAGLLRERRIGLLKLEVLPGRFYARQVPLHQLEQVLSPLGYRLLTVAGLHYAKEDAALTYFDAFFRPAD